MESSVLDTIRITKKVLLHVHLDGAARIETILSLAKKRGIVLPIEDYDELKKALVMTEPETLTTFLQRFKYFAPAFIGDLDAIRTLAYEFAEDVAADDVIYCEARFCPHLLIGASSLSPDEIVEAVAEQFQLVEEKSGIRLKIILCCMRSMPEISLDILRLCEKYRDKGVVGIDIAGDENMIDDGQPTEQQHIEAFQLAKEKGISRTVHAGENGPSNVVEEAIVKMHAERIGHGYRTLMDEVLYKRLIHQRVHFEMCPWSSVLTGACDHQLERHALKRFSEDNGNFSINTDDPIITGTTLSQEYELVEKSVGISKLRLVETIFDAARAAFCSPAEKIEIIGRLKAEYGYIKETVNF